MALAMNLYSHQCGYSPSTCQGCFSGKAFRSHAWVSAPVALVAPEILRRREKFQKKATSKWPPLIYREVSLGYLMYIYIIYIIYICVCYLYIKLRWY